MSVQKQLGPSIQQLLRSLNGDGCLLKSTLQRAGILVQADPIDPRSIEGRELFDIMAREIEIARGLFKVLSGRLREAHGQAQQTTSGGG